MHLSLHDKNTVLQLTPGLPADYRGPILKSAESFYGNSQFANIVIQELKDEFYALRFIILKAFKNLQANDLIQTKGLYCNFVLKNNLRKRISTIGNLHIRQGQYFSLYGSMETCESKIENDTEIRILHLFYSNKLLKELSTYFPQLNNIIDSNSSIILKKAPTWILPSMGEITNQILNCPFDEATQKFYFDLKVRELLYQILEDAFSVNQESQKFTPFEIARIHDARTILSSFIDKKPISIKKLSKKVALNEYKLKVGFKQYFNSGIAEWLIEQKMQHARQLVLSTNLPIKHICSAVGYPRTTNFITAFRRRFGYTPGSLRRS